MPATGLSHPLQRQAGRAECCSCKTCVWKALVLYHTKACGALMGMVPGAGSVQMADGSAPGLAEVLDMKAFANNT